VLFSVFLEFGRIIDDYGLMLSFWLLIWVFFFLNLLGLILSFLSIVFLFFFNIFFLIFPC
jgi:hypothetical protein